MDIQKLIHDYMDGTLDPSNEEKLFASLSSDPYLRDELKNEMQLKSLIANDTEAYAPRTESLDAIGAKLGFEGFTNSKVPKAGFWSQYQQGIMSSLVTAIGAAIIYLLLPFNGAFSENNDQFITSNEDQGNTKVIIDTVFNEKVVEVPTYIEKIVYTENIGTDQVEPPQFISNSLLASNDQLLKLNTTRSSADILPISKNIVSSHSLLGSFGKEIDLPDINIETSLNSFYSNDPLTFDKNYQSLNNLSLSVLFAHKNRFSFGLDLTRENFYQTFVVNSDDKSLKYYQNPDYTTVSFLARYNYNLIDISGLNTFFQASIGVPVSERSNFSGIVSRLGMGLNYDINQNFYLTTLVNFNMMNYYQNQISYISDKLGVRAGLGIKLR